MSSVQCEAIVNDFLTSRRLLSGALYTIQISDRQDILFDSMVSTIGMYGTATA